MLPTKQLTKKPTNEFFNLFIKREVEYQSFFKDVCVSVITKKEVLQYFKYLKLKKLGQQPIGSKKVEIIEPQSFNIYDFSKYLTNNPGATKPDLIKAVNKRLKNETNSEEVFSELGIDVTDSFGIRLEDVLEDFESSNLQTTNASKATSKNESLNPESASYKLEGSPIELTINTKDDGQVNLDVSNPYIPNEFSGGIIDSSINPTFNVEKIAKVFANHLINLKHESGQMVGVFGKWGRGKTYFIKEVCKHLKLDFEKESSESDSDFVLIKFQAWKYQSTPSIWAYLFDTIIEGYLGKRWNKAFRILSISVEKNGSWNSWIKYLILILIGFSWFFLVPFETKVNTPIQFIKWIGGIGAFFMLLYKIVFFIRFSGKPAKIIFDSITKTPSFKSILGIQAEIQKEMVFLIRAWANRLNMKKWDWGKFKFVKSSNKRLLLFIDDLDRCSEDHMIEIVDALRVMLDDPELNKHLLVLVAIDESILKKAVEHKYKERRKGEDLGNLCTEYLDKLFISAIKLPPISFEQRIVFVENLAYQINKTIPAHADLLNITESLKKSISVSEKKVDDENQNEIIDKTSAAILKKKISDEIGIIQLILENFEIDLLKNKVAHVSQELTPRQIRIFIFRYLLARNIWRSLFEGIEFKTEDTVNIILNQAFGEPKIDFDIDKNLNEIVQMVVTY